MTCKMEDDLTLARSVFTAGGDLTHERTSVMLVSIAFSLLVFSPRSDPHWNERQLLR